MLKPFGFKKNQLKCLNGVPDKVMHEYVCDRLEAAKESRWQIWILSFSIRYATWKQIFQAHSVQKLPFEYTMNKNHFIHSNFIPSSNNKIALANDSFEAMKLLRKRAPLKARDLQNKPCGSRCDVVLLSNTSSYSCKVVKFCNIAEGLSGLDWENDRDMLWQRWYPSKMCDTEGETRL